jgi:hypothetical protein
MRGHSLPVVDVHVTRSPSFEGAFGRMFRRLPPFDPPGATEADKVRWLMQRGDSLHGGDGPRPDNPDVAVAYTYLGQFINHDVTFDAASSLDRQTDPDRLVNFRTPRLDLDALYGRGPMSQPCLYEECRVQGRLGFLLRLGRARAHDASKNHDELDLHREAGLWVYAPKHRVSVLVRDGDCYRIVPKQDVDPKHVTIQFHTTWARMRGDGRVLLANGEWARVDPDAMEVLGERALIGDPRNDENVPVSQVHLAFARFHNLTMLEVLETTALAGLPAFEEAQRRVRWHFQWIVLHDFLPAVVGQRRMDKLLARLAKRGLAGLKSFRWRNDPFLPVEFSAAVFRFGHAMVRDAYLLNDLTGEPPTPVFVADPSGARADLRGGRRLPERWSVQWDRWLSFKGSEPQRSATLGRRLSPRLRAVPGPHAMSLGAADLLRGWRMQLPSGNAIARAMGKEPVTGEELPLFEYVLEEAQQRKGGRRLGPVGGRIVAEVLAGLVAGDPDSYVNVHPRWRPEIRSFQHLLHAVRAPLTVADLPFAKP